MKPSTVEYRTTKSILEGIVRKSDKFSKFDYKTIFHNGGMFYCVKPQDGKSIYEVKMIRRKRAEGSIFEPNGISTNKDENKANYLASIKDLLSCVFKNVCFHNGEVVVVDDNNNYNIYLVKKTGFTW